MSNSALVVFVKTPGVTPAKTRLAAKIGSEKAEEFYLFSLRMIEQLLNSCKEQLGVTPIWAVAESDQQDAEIWQKFDCISQHQGSLGERLHFAYEHLIKEFDSVHFMGADAPQMEISDIRSALDQVSSENFVLGPARDGGYYLFSGAKELPKSVWMNVPYSVSNTAEVFIRELSDFGTVSKLRELRDVDEVEDLAALIESWEKSNPDASAYLRKMIR